ncbi:MAG: site-specific integrase [Gammaproteobacteria bacterium]|nr:site-specific integrase [Gammaproteobacteria bacterium]
MPTEMRQQSLERNDEGLPLIIHALALGLSGGPATNAFPEPDHSIELTKQWIERQRKRKTQDAYRSETEKFFLWMRLTLKKSPTELRLADFKAYHEFLKEPLPAKMWCGPIRPRQVPRKRAEQMENSTRYSVEERAEIQKMLETFPDVDVIPNPLWRPFKGGRPEQGIRYSLNVLHSLFEFLVTVDCIHGNPLALPKLAHPDLRLLSANRPKNVPPKERAFDDIEWRAIQEACEAMPRSAPWEQDAYERMRFLLNLYYYLGARLCEPVLLSMGSIEKRTEGWFWYVRTKNGEEAELPVCAPLMDALRRYRSHLNLAPLPFQGENVPLVLSRKGKKPIGTRQVHSLFKRLFANAAQIMRARGDHHRDLRLRSANMQWLRHTFVMHLSEATDDPNALQYLARFGSYRTVKLYISPGRREKQRVIASLKDKS